MTKDNTPRIMLLDAESFAENTEPGIVLLDISRQEIESGAIASALDRLMVMTDSPENVALYREKLIFQVRGYDNDPRELPEITEVREFFRKLTEQWPHWLWFAMRGVGAIGLIVALLVPTKVEERRGAEFSALFEWDAVKQTMDMLLERGLVPLSLHGITPQDAAEAFDSAWLELAGMV